MLVRVNHFRIHLFKLHWGHAYHFNKLNENDIGIPLLK